MRIDIIKTIPLKEGMADARTKLEVRMGTINAVEMRVDNEAEVQQIINLCVAIADAKEPVIMVVKEVNQNGEV